MTKNIYELISNYKDADEVIRYLLDKELLNEFDFSDDCSCEFYNRIEDVILKYITYKVYSVKSEDTEYEYFRILESFLKDKKGCYNINVVKKVYGLISINDPDSNSKALQCIYKKLYKDQTCFKTDKKNKIHGDTMNSAQTTINKSLELFIKENEELSKEIKDYNIKKGRDISIRFLTELYLLYDKKVNEKFIPKTDFTVESFFNDIGAVDFLNVYHTLGNFIPVPPDFNTSRRRNLNDYWDITLACIYNYYANEDQKIFTYDIKEMFKNKKSKDKENIMIKEYKAYLGTFKSWNNFVKQNYLQPFVEKNGENSFGKPKELWKGHFGGDIMPKNIDQCKEFFENATKMIKNRTELMAREL